MTLTPAARSVQDRSAFTSHDSRSLHGFLALPLRALRSYGQASRTLAALIAAARMDRSSRTSRPQSTVGKIAKVSTKTLYRHCLVLEQAGMIKVHRRRDQTNTVTIRDRCMEDGFLAVPRYALDLPWTHCLVLSWLVWRAGLSNDGSSAQVTYGAVATALGIPRRSVIRAAAALLESGYIARTDGGFRLLPPPIEGGDNLTDRPIPQVVTMCPMPGDKVTAKEEGTKESMVHRKKPVDRKLIPAKTLAGRALSLFQGIGYRGNQGRNLWKIAAAAELGLVTESEVADAVAGCRECRPGNRPAYFYAIMRQHLRKRDENLPKLLSRVIVTPQCPAAPPADGRRRKKASQDRSDRTGEPLQVSKLMERLGLLGGRTESRAA